MTVLLIAVGAVVGAPLRYIVDWLLGRWRYLPWGTLVVNVIGSAVLGFISAASADPAFLALVGTGFCGALTTFSTFSYESLVLIQQRAYGRVLLSVGGNVVFGIAALVLGWQLG